MRLNFVCFFYAIIKLSLMQFLHGLYFYKEEILCGWFYASHSLSYLFKEERGSAEWDGMFGLVNISEGIDNS